MKQTVLLGFADALAAPECAFSLLDAGYDVIGFARRGSKPPLRRVSGIHVLEITSPAEDAQRAVEDLRSLAEAAGAAVVMPLDDASIWLVAEAASRGVSAAVAGPHGGAAQLALDKRRQLDLAREAGFVVPETAAGNTPAEVTPPRPPVVVKGALAVACIENRLLRAPSRYCGTEAELELALGSWPAGQPLLVQAAIAGVGEGIFGLAIDGVPHAVSGHRRVRMMNPRGSGSSACRSQRVADHDASAAAAFLSRARWSGLFMIELLRDMHGRAVFMELNGRAWGSMALARRLGIEYPAWAVTAVLDPSFVPPEISYESLLCRHAGREIVHLLTVLHGPPGSRPPGWPSRVTTLRHVLRLSRSDVWYNARAGEARFFLADIARTVMTELRRTAS